MGRLIRQEGGGGRLLQRSRIDPVVLDFGMGTAQPLSKSVRLNGFATCLRLEKVYWDVLSDISQGNDCSINALLSYIDREVHLRHGGVKNFSGLIRVVCVMHLMKADRSSHEVLAEQVLVG
ncbi:ribbon-helix-helix domain-containing protein [Pseudomonas sp. SIMBA_077]